MTTMIRKNAKYDVDNVFTNHPPKNNQQQRYEKFREKAKELAILYLTHSDDSRELFLALTKLEESVMWANAGIARNE